MPYPKKFNTTQERTEAAKASRLKYEDSHLRIRLDEHVAKKWLELKTQTGTTSHSAFAKLLLDRYLYIAFIYVQISNCIFYQFHGRNQKSECQYSKSNANFVWQPPQHAHTLVA